MADREDTSSLSAEEKIARILEELETRIDSQADRLTAQLAPVERNVSAIEENLRILGYENGAPTPENERYRPRATSDPNPAEYETPKPEARGFENVEPESPDVEVPQFRTPEFEDPDAEGSDFEEPEIPAATNPEPVGSEPDTPEFEDRDPARRDSDARKFDGPRLVEPAPETPAFEPPNPGDPEPEESWTPETFHGDEQTFDDTANDDGGSDAQRSGDLPFETDGPSDEDMNLADEVLKSDLVGLFDDGEHADKNPAPLDPVVKPTPFPDAATPTRSRPVYLLLVAFMFLAASMGIGAFIWFELTSPELRPVAEDQRPVETTDSVVSPERPNKPAGPSPVQATASDPDKIETSAPDPMATPETAAPEAAEAETAKSTKLPEQELATNTTAADNTPGTEMSSRQTTDAPVPEKPASENPEIDSLRDLAAAGDSEAQYEIAVRHLVGRGVEQDYVLAAKWLQEAAAGGVISAQYNLGVLYDSGRGVEADPVEALIWFHSAAEKGHGRAQYALAAAYAAGRGIERDSDMALKWLRRAAAENILEAQSSLANILATSPVSHDSLEEAYYWYRLADANGDGKAADKAELVAARLTAEERADVNRRVSAFIAANIAGTRRQTLPPAPPAPPAAPTITPATNAPNKAAPTTGTQARETPTGSTATRERVVKIQALLTRLGFDPGPADGALGAETRDAIRNYQRALGLDVNGEPSESLLAHLRQISGIRK